MRVILAAAFWSAGYSVGNVLPVMVIAMPLRLVWQYMLVSNGQTPGYWRDTPMGGTAMLEDTLAKMINESFTRDEHSSWSSTNPVRSLGSFYGIGCSLMKSWWQHSMM
eukprot:4530591-Ditylum_brightwellii.AAC.1